MLHESHKTFIFLVFIALQSHNDNDNTLNFERETNVDDGIGWYFWYLHLLIHVARQIHVARTRKLEKINL
jgi:hypothetical protein